LWLKGKSEGFSDRAGFRGAEGPRAPGLPPNPSRGRERKGRMGGIAPPFLKSQIRHWAPGLPPAKSGPVQ